MRSYNLYDILCITSSSYFTSCIYLYLIIYMIMYVYSDVIYNELTYHSNLYFVIRIRINNIIVKDVQNMKLVDICEDVSNILIDDIIDKIKNNCGKYLKECGKNLVYRGINKEGFLEPMSIIKHRDDRIPVNSTKVAHDLFDDYSLEKFGIKIRSNSLFVSGDYYRARDYAFNGKNIYVIFPMDDFSFVWSENVDDFYVAGEDMPDAQTNNINTYIPTDEYRKEIYEFFDSLEYTNTNLSKAIKSNNEIMLHAKSYYAIRVCDLYYSLYDTNVDTNKINKILLKGISIKLFEMLNK